MIKTDLTGKVALVSGGTGGIGSMICEQLALNGATVYISGRSIEKGEAVLATIQEKGGKAYFVQGDISVEEDCLRIFRQIEENDKSVDILVNNAGGNINLDRRGKIFNYHEDAWEETIDKCMDGVYFLTRCALPYMKKNGGRIINVGSVTGFRMGLRNQAAYNVSKAAMHNITRCSASELAPYGITVNCVIPGTTWHKTFRERHLKDPAMAEKFLSHVPTGEANVPEDMAAAVLMLVSEEGSRMNGILLNIDGGWAAGFCK